MRFAPIILFLTVYPVVVLAAIGCPKGTVPNGEQTHEVSEAWCELETNRALLHGPYRAWYSNGVAGTIEHYDQGKREGKAAYRWDNGKKQATGQYKNGVWEGVWLFWEKSGATAGRAKYQRGALVSGQVPNWAVERDAPQAARPSP